MALITCKECGQQVSTEAKACPSCGAEARKPMGRLRKGLLIFLGGSILVGAVMEDTRKGSTPPKTPEQIAAEKRADDAYSKRVTAAMAVAATLKDNARNPDSVVFDSMRVSEDAKVICTEFRAQNGFGGMNREHAVVVGKIFSKSSSVWNKNCLKDMYDHISAVK